MRGATLGMAVLMAAATTLALAQTPRQPRPTPVAPPARIAPLFAAARPAPPVPRPIPVPAAPPRFTPVVLPKTPNYTARAIALVQQNIALQAAMRVTPAARPCDPTWSARKLKRRGCVSPEPARSEPAVEPAPPLARTTLAAGQAASDVEN